MSGERMKYGICLPLPHDAAGRRETMRRAFDALRDKPGVPIARTVHSEGFGMDLFVVIKYPPDVARRVLARQMIEEEAVGR